MRVFGYFFLFLMIFPPSKSMADNNEFRAPWWCRGAHMQTVYGGLFRENINIPYRRERMELKDGDFLDLDFYDGDPSKPTVLIFHGLASTSASTYVKTLADEIHQNGWNAAVMIARGQSGEPNRLKGTNHAGNIADVDAAVKYVLETRKPESLYLVGFSLGGNMLMKWLGDNSEFIPYQVKSAAAVSAAYDLAKVASLLDGNFFNREVYVRSMLKFLKPLAEEKEKRFPGSLNVEKVKRAKTFRVYDREVTAHLNGFKDENEYWRLSSSMNSLSSITVPSLLIHADNDPFLPASELPYTEMLKSSSVKLLVTRDGGHLGFVSGGWPGRSDRWLEKNIMEYFSLAESASEKESKESKAER